MDVYLPAGRNENISKVLVLIHGGGWSGGSKEDMDYAIAGLNAAFPKYAIVNIGYRLGTVQSPGFPKQIDDIKLALNYVKSKRSEYKINPVYGMFGNSAGGHLALLYGSAYDPLREVKVICNQVGPVDFTDPSYSANPVFTYALFPLVGNYTYAQNPQLYRQVSPVTHVTSQSPKTISLYGDSDPLIPTVQGGLLEDKLDSVGVYNKFYLYQGDGHGNWSPTHAAHMVKKIIYFFNNYF